MKMMVAGFYKFRIFDGETRELKKETSFERNLITDQGLNRMGSANDYLNYCHVGSGSANPQNSDTGLQSFVAASSSYSGARGIESAASPAYGWIRRTYTFVAGAAAGNLSEVSVGWLLENGGAFSRSLIRDAGVPITLTVGPSDILQVVYELRNIAPVTDIEFNCTIAGVQHACVARPSDLSSEGSYWDFWGGPFDFGSMAFSPASFETSVLGERNARPSGPPSSGAHSNVAYASGTYFRDFNVDFSLSAGNFQSGIGSILLNLSNGRWQVSFTPKIQKNNTRTLRITFRVSWGRA